MREHEQMFEFQGFKLLLQLVFLCKCWKEHSATRQTLEVETHFKPDPLTHALLSHRIP